MGSAPKNATSRSVDPKLLVLIVTAGVDMLGMLMVLPLLPFYAKRMGANGFIYGCLVASFSVASLVASPIWGRFSDRYGRRPALLIALGASAMAYVIFAFAQSIPMLLLSRLIQGAGGGTVGVLQAYVADTSAPKDRTRSLGWLSAATNVGVTFGPLLGSWALTIGKHPFIVNHHNLALGTAAPGLLAAVVCVANMYFAWRYLGESHEGAVHAGRAARVDRTLNAMADIVVHTEQPASRLIWIYALALGAYLSANTMLAFLLANKFNVTAETIGYVIAYIGVINIIARALLLGIAVDKLGEARLARVGTLILATGLCLIPLTPNKILMAIAIAMVPLGTAFTFPCVTGMLSRVISPDERGLYMGVQQTFGGITRSLFPLAAGLLYDRIAPGAPFWAGGIIVAATLLLGLKMESYLGGEPIPTVLAASGTPAAGSPAIDVPTTAPPVSGATVTRA